MRFGRAMRVRARADFEKAKATGRRFVTGPLILQIRVRPEGEAGVPVPRLGLVVSRRVGGAVERNRVKRRLRHLFRESVGSRPGAYDLIAIARPSIRGLDFPSLRQEFERAYDRLYRGEVAG